MAQRHYVQSGLLFITTTTLNRKPIFADPAFARAAIDALYHTQNLYPFFLYAFVIMPNHCHFLLSVPEGGFISKIIYGFKRSVCFEIAIGPLWQERFFQKTITEEPERVRRYIHMNPVKAGFCEAPEDYPWSSASDKWDIQEFI